MPARSSSDNDSDDFDPDDFGPEDDPMPICGGGDMVAIPSWIARVPGITVCDINTYIHVSMYPGHTWSEWKEEAKGDEAFLESFRRLVGMHLIWYRANPNRDDITTYHVEILPVEWIEDAWAEAGIASPE